MKVKAERRNENMNMKKSVENVKNRKKISDKEYNSFMKNMDKVEKYMAKFKFSPDAGLEALKKEDNQTGNMQKNKNKLVRNFEKNLKEKEKIKNRPEDRMSWQKKSFKRVNRDYDDDDERNKRSKKKSVKGILNDYIMRGERNDTKVETVDNTEKLSLIIKKDFTNDDDDGNEKRRKNNHLLRKKNHSKHNRRHGHDTVDEYETLCTVEYLINSLYRKYFSKRFQEDKKMFGKEKRKTKNRKHDDNEVEHRRNKKSKDVEDSIRKTNRTNKKRQKIRYGKRGRKISSSSSSSVSSSESEAEEAYTISSDSGTEIVDNFDYDENIIVIEPEHYPFAKLQTLPPVCYDKNIQTDYNKVIQVDKTQITEYQCSRSVSVQSHETTSTGSRGFAEKVVATDDKQEYNERLEDDQIYNDKEFSTDGDPVNVGVSIVNNWKQICDLGVLNNSDDGQTFSASFDQTNGGNDLLDVVEINEGTGDQPTQMVISQHRRSANADQQQQCSNNSGGASVKNCEQNCEEKKEESINMRDVVNMNGHTSIMANNDCDRSQPFAEELDKPDGQPIVLQQYNYQNQVIATEKEQLQFISDEEQYFECSSNSNNGLVNVTNTKQEGKKENDYYELVDNSDGQKSAGSDADNILVEMRSEYPASEDSNCDIIKTDSNQNCDLLNE